MKERNVTSAIYVRMRLYRRVIWRVICSFIPIKSRINVIIAFNHLGKSSYSNGTAISIIILRMFLHHHKKKRINVPNAKEHLGVYIDYLKQFMIG